MEDVSFSHTHTLSLCLSSFPLYHSLIYSWLLYSVSLSLPLPFLLPAPPPSLPFSLFAPILISALSIVGSAHPTHAHGLNEILYVRDPCMQL